jgi:hypothetical protein
MMRVFADVVTKLDFNQKVRCRCLLLSPQLLAEPVARWFARLLLR